MFAYLYIMLINWFNHFAYDQGWTHEWVKHYLYLGSNEAVISFVGFELFCIVLITIWVALIYGAIKSDDIHIMREVKTLIKA